MSETTKEPRNPFYWLLLAASLLFVLTAIAYAVIPLLVDQARMAGQPMPPSAFRDDLRDNGWVWLLAEVAAMFVFGVASMGLDRWRRLREELDQIKPNG